MAEYGVGIAGGAVVADEERPVETPVGVLYHRERFAVAEDDAHVAGQLVEEKIAHRTVRVVDEHLGRTGRASAFDRARYLLRVVSPVDRKIRMWGSSVDLLPRADARDAFHIAGDI